MSSIHRTARVGALPFFSSLIVDFFLLVRIFLKHFHLMSGLPKSFQQNKIYGEKVFKDVTALVK